MGGTQAKAWTCSVCGYVHYGAEPPDECPFCGAEQDLFEAYIETPPAQVPAAPEQWRCLNCGYSHAGLAPLDRCPVCAAPSDRFEPVVPEEPARHPAGAVQRAVIVGAGIAGVSAAGL